MSSFNFEFQDSNLERCCISVALLLSILVQVGVCGDAVLDVVNQVSVDQYRVYEVDIESMGLGLYGGPAYNENCRNRDGRRGAGTLGNQEARLYLTDQLLSLGLATTIQGDYRNVVAELPGVRTPEKIYIICGHYDTTEDGEYPGGDDNASGTAGVLEAARVLSRYRFNATVRFIGFNAEEDWMWGSQDYVDKILVPNRENVLGVINLDMILRPGWDSRPAWPIDLELETGKSAQGFAWVNVFRKAAAAYVPSLVIDPDAPFTTYWDAGDQGPFITAGYPTLLAIDNTATEIWGGDINAYYHSAEDASDKLANSKASPSGVTYDYDFAADVVRATVATAATQAGMVAKRIPGFAPYQSLPTETSEHIEKFEIRNAELETAEDYLLVVNQRNVLTYDVNSTLYKWDGASFLEYQSIPTHGASDAEFFTLGGDVFLAIANMYDGTTHNIDSKIYKWDGAHFIEFQSLPTQGAGDLEFFPFEDSAYLAVANLSNDVTHNIESRIYKWDGACFAEFQTIPTNAAEGLEFFMLEGKAYLAVANACNGATYNVDSKICRWNGSRFTGFQSIPTSGACKWRFFTIAGESYLAVANSYDGVTHDVDSRIYKWNGTNFAVYQSIRTHWATDWEFFTIAGESYLAVANRGGDGRLYRWNGTRFVEFASLATEGACDWEFFTLDDSTGGFQTRPYLAAAGVGDGATSILYQYQGPYTGNLDDDNNVDLRDYALFAATWRARQGQADWNENCDISVPADNVIDLRDLAVLADNWLKQPSLARATQLPPPTKPESPYPKR